jgi:hypothetical protein
MPVFIDFLTEHPTATSGTASIDGIPAGVFPGVARALATRRKVRVEGRDLFGVSQKMTPPVSGIGALLVLKLNAFAGQRQGRAKFFPRDLSEPGSEARRKYPRMCARPSLVRASWKQADLSLWTNAAQDSEAQ